MSDFKVVRGLSVFVLALTLSSQSSFAEQNPTSRTNILWISIDDQSPWYGTYGDARVKTPNIDALAAQGVVFERAYAPSPVCSPTRSAIITGTYSIRTGTHDHRSGRVSSYQIRLPAGVTTVPQIFRKAGYTTYNGGKDDFNFAYDRSDLYSIVEGFSFERNQYTQASNTFPKRSITSVKHKATVTKPELAKAKSTLGTGDQSWKGPAGGGDWRDVPGGSSFFGQMSVAGGKGVKNLESQLRLLGYTPVKPADVRVPAQYPDIPQVRRHLADHYNSVLRTDYQVGQTVSRLKADGLWKNTVIFLYSDHGSDLPRSKEFTYAEGLHVPLIVVAPGMSEVVKPGSRRSDLVNLIDIAATSLALSNLSVPDYMDSKNLFAQNYSRDYVFSSADRMSNVIDRVRSVMGERYHYIRNFMIDRPLMNWGHREMISLADPEESSFLKIRRLAEQGKLTFAQASPYGPRVPEELYDLQNDPDEVVNLAQDPVHAEQLDVMRRQLENWIVDTDDKGQYPRSKAAWTEITERFPSSWLRSPEFQ